MMNNLQESILIKSSSKIDFMNLNFVSLFQENMDSHSSDFDKGFVIEEVQPSFLDKVKQIFLG
jgi:hypothetical protein